MDDPTSSYSEQASPTESAEATPHVAAHHDSVVEPLAEVMTPAPEPELVDEKPRKRSSWETLASMFNIQIDRTPAPEAPAAVAPAKPPTPPPAAPRERESREREPRSAHREKPRFNEPRREREPEKREPETRLQVFPESRGSQENPALEELFAEVPRGDLDSWKKPPRVVDDLSWDEVPASTDDAVEPEFISEAFGSDAELSAEDKVEADDRPPRRRRRRRGPRRPEGTEPVSPRAESDLDDVESIVPGDEYSEPENFEVGLSDSEEPVSEIDPERRSSRRRRRGRKRPVDDSGAPSHPDARQDDGELNAERASERPGDRPERMPRSDRPSERSSERTSERTSERPERSVDRSRSRSAEGSAERTSDRGSDRGSERGPERTSDRSAERPSRSERSPERGPERSGERGAERGSERGTERTSEGRRERRTERPEPRADRPPRVREERPLPPRSDVEELDDVDELEDLDSGDVEEKHRNIPSWADSLQSIIEGNMENHKRNDNRGGPPRGRPRSRR